jgi:5'-3' exonuclease
MGVEGFIGHYLRVKKFKNVELKYVPTSVGSLYIDSNSLLHEAAQYVYAYGKYDDEKKQSQLSLVDPAVLEAQFLDQIIINFKAVFKTFKPTHFMMISIDGPATIAKIIQQRSRRYKNSIHTNKLVTFKSSAISPGTDLMFAVDAKIKQWLDNSYIYLCPTVIYSNHLVHLEGETKLFNYLKNPEYSFQGAIVFYGLDTDLVFLSLASGISNIYLSRNNENDIINIDAFKIAINSIYLQTTSVIDFMFLSFFIGNDFLPRILAFSDIPTAYDTIETWYKALKSGIVEFGDVDWNIFYQFLNNVANREKSLLQSVATTTTKYENPVFKFSFDVVSNGSGGSIKVFNYSNFRNYYYAHALNPKITNLDQSDLAAFVPTDETITNMCINYLSVMAWNLKFYIKGALGVNVEYCYRYNYAPLLTDLRDVLGLLIEKDSKYTFERYIPLATDRMMNPLQQLLCIIPPTDKLVIPSIAHPYTYFDSPIYDLFPVKFQIDYSGKNEDYQGIALLSPISPDTVFKSVTFSNEVLQKYKPVGDYVYTQNIKSDIYKARKNLYTERKNNSKPVSESLDVNNIGGSERGGYRGRGGSERGSYRGRGRGGSERGSYRGRGRGGSERGAYRGRGGFERGGYRGRGALNNISTNTDTNTFAVTQ